MDCNGECNGEIVVTPSGGISPYRHSWNTGSISDSLNNLCPATYIDTIFDDNGCFMVDSFVIEEPEVFTVSVIDSSDLRCFGVCEGTATVQGIGGTSLMNLPGITLQIIRLVKQLLGYVPPIILFEEKIV